MPVNKNALIRYKTIDKCLQNKYRRWTLEDLIEACSDALYEYEGIRSGVSRRTVQLDIQMMRSDKLGYNAPIVVDEKKYYRYAEADYSIMNSPISESDLEKLSQTVDFLKQFKGFAHFKELDAMVHKLEDQVHAQKEKRRPVIDFEKNEALKGIEHLEVLYNAIAEKRVIEITYQSFKARQSDAFILYPYLLKEFRNRWFVIGSKNNAYPMLTLAIDRIVELKVSDKHFEEGVSFDAESYFRNVIGVTVLNQEAEEVQLFVTHYHAPYVLTKPLHHSQKLVERTREGIVISLFVQHNYELEKEILGFGDGMRVISPKRLRRNIKKRLKQALERYETPSI